MTRAADIQASGFLIEFLQHLRGKIEVHPLDGIIRPPVENRVTSLPWSAMRAMASALMGFFFLGMLFINCYFFSPGLPECHHLAGLTVIIVPNFKDQRVEPAFHPARRTILFRYLAR
jgi:hypothetical protein